MTKRLFVLLLLCYSTYNTWAQLPGLPTFATRARAYLDSLGKAQAFSGGILLAQDGKVLLEHYVGYADWKQQKPFDSKTAFNVGSNTKDITKLLIAQLVVAGRLQYSDNLGMLFPSWPADKHNIAITQLLAHTSGLGDYHRDPRFSFGQRPTREQLASIISTSELLFAPGQGQEYSNSGYVTLGLIIEKLHGKSYLEVVQKDVYDKIGMQHSYMHTNLNEPYVARPHFRRLQGGFVAETDLNSSVMTKGDGCTYHTLSDWLLFVQKGFLGDEIIDKNARNTMIKALLGDRKEGEEVRVGGGGGPRHDEKEEAPIFDGGFAGGLPGWNTCFNYRSKDKLVLIIFSNGGGAVGLDQPAEELAPVMADLLRGKSPRPFGQAPDVRLYQAIRQQGTERILADPRAYLQQQGSDLPGPVVMQRVGTALLEDKAESTAIAVFEANNKFFPRYAPSYMTLGQVYERSGNTEKAKATYQKLLGVNPNHEGAQEALARL